MRILVIDDAARRIERLLRWLPERDSSVGHVRLVWARSGPEALALLARERGESFQGVMVDHDLDKDPERPSEAPIHWEALTEALQRATDATLPVLIHAMNPFPVPEMLQLLRIRTPHRTWGRPIEVVRFADLCRYGFHAWLAVCRERDDSLR